MDWSIKKATKKLHDQKLEAQRARKKSVLKKMAINKRRDLLLKGFRRLGNFAYHQRVLEKDRSIGDLQLLNKSMGA